MRTTESGGREIGQQFMSALRASGLKDEAIRSILEAPEELKILHHIVTDIETHVLRLQSLRLDTQ